MVAQTRVEVAGFYDSGACKTCCWVEGQYEGDEAKHTLASGQSTQKDKEPLAEMREACSWEDTNPDWAGR